MNSERPQSRTRTEILCDTIHNLKWRKPSFLGGVVTIIYLTSALFYVIAISTNHWVEISASRANIGLWSACVTDTDEVETCSSQLFYIYLVKSGTHWHTIHQWMMPIGLVFWFCEEFVIVAVVFMQRSNKSDILIGVNIMFTAVTAICLFLTLVIIGTEAGHLKDSALSWSFYVAILSLLVIVISGIMTTVFLHVENNKGRLPCFNSTSQT